MQLKNCIKCSIAHILHYTTDKQSISSLDWTNFQRQEPPLGGILLRQVRFDREKAHLYTSGIPVTLHFRG